MNKQRSCLSPNMLDNLLFIGQNKKYLFVPKKEEDAKLIK